MTATQGYGPQLGAGRFLGELQQRLDLPDAALSETRYPDAFTAEPHTHERAFLCLVLRGCYTESTGATRRECGPFSVTIHPPGETHHDRFHSAGACFNVELTSPNATWEALSAAPPVPGSNLPFLAARLYVAFRQGNQAATALTEELLLELEASLTPAVALSRHRPSWLPRAIDRLNSPNAATDIRSIAADLGLHPVYMARAFRRRVGCSPSAWQRRAILARAAARLASTTPASRVALDAGFADQSHFHRCFGRAIGVSPGRWRALIGSGTRRQVAPVQDSRAPAG